MGDLRKGSLHYVAPFQRHNARKWQSVVASFDPRDGGLAEGRGNGCQRPAAGLPKDGEM